jgi:putative FmdB family regulatory protein
MPLYEYKCAACAHRFERIVKFSDPALKICPQCGKSAVEQLISASSMRFKGTGWYQTDYARKALPPDPSSSAKLLEGGSGSASAGKESGSNGSASKSSDSSSSDQGSSSGSSSSASGSTSGDSGGPATSSSTSSTGDSK